MCGMINLSECGWFLGHRIQPPSKLPKWLVPVWRFCLKVICLSGSFWTQIYQASLSKNSLANQSIGCTIWSTKRPHGTWKEFSISLYFSNCFPPQLVSWTIYAQRFTGCFLFMWLGLERKTGRTHSFHPIILNIQVLQQLGETVLAAKGYSQQHPEISHGACKTTLELANDPDFLPKEQQQCNARLCSASPSCCQNQEKKTPALHFFGNASLSQFKLIGSLFIFFICFTDRSTSPLKDQWMYIV